ncbi:insulinase family protein [bacterium CPR1]|nr:insulinase family protein [bacterium CPR1]
MSSNESQVPFATLASDVVRAELPNGVRLLVKEVYPTRVVSVGLWVGVGSVDDPADQLGISHFVEHLLFKSSGDQGEGALARSLHELGGHLNGFTTHECTCYWVVLPSRHFQAGLTLLARAIGSPGFLEAECRREEQVIRQELRMYQDRPDAFCFEHLLALAFPDHPYGRPVLGRENTLQGLSPELLRGHYERYYGASNLAVVVVGEVESELVLESVSRVMGNWALGPATPRFARPFRGGTGFRAVDLEGPINTGHLQLGFSIPGLADPAAYACDLLSSVLGRGRSSRLGRSLRERGGLVSQIKAGTMIERDPGLLVVEAVLAAERFEEVEEALWVELALLAQDGVSERELVRAKNQAEASFVMAQETVEGQGRKLGYYEMMGDFSLADQYVAHLTQVDQEALLTASRRYLTRENVCLVRYRPVGS